MAKAQKVQSPRPRRLPAGTHLDECLRSFMNHPDVQVVYVGKKRKNGEETGRLSIVLGVREKLPEEGLDDDRRLPKKMVFGKESGWRSVIPTDVHQMEGRLEVQANRLGPADIFDPGTPFEATIGMALLHPTFGKVVTTAGHAIPQGIPPNSRLAIRSAGMDFLAEVKRRVTNQASDHALLRPDNQDLVANSFGDVTPLGPPYIPDPAHDVGMELFVLTASRGRVPTVCRGLKGSLTVAHLVMNDLIFTDAVTNPGDSGACLVDGKWRVWGLLLGELRTRDEQDQVVDFSVFVPAFRVLFLENAQFL